uniref:Uncharacterized protein n=1 Tax=Steinernema glaseri TaxID=37863 RepID=A0A1I7Y768_9BILA
MPPLWREYSHLMCASHFIKRSPLMFGSCFYYHSPSFTSWTQFLLSFASAFATLYLLVGFNTRKNCPPTTDNLQQSCTAVRLSLNVGRSFDVNATSVARIFTLDVRIALRQAQPINVRILLLLPFSVIYIMDAVPFVFCERVCDTLSPRGLQHAEELSTNYGQLAAIMYDRKVSYQCSVKKGIESSACMLHLKDSNLRNALRLPEQIAAVPKQFVSKVTIKLMDAEDENVSQEVVRRFPNAECHFHLYSSSINEAWVDFACSLNRFITVVTAIVLEDKAIPLLRKLVDSRKLLVLSVLEETCRDGNLGVIRPLLCQEQNAEECRGKRVSIHWNNLSSSESAVKGFRVYKASLKRKDPIYRLYEVSDKCWKEECHLISRYNRRLHKAFPKPAFLYKFKQEEQLPSYIPARQAIPDRIHRVALLLYALDNVPVPSFTIPNFLDLFFV